MGKRSKRSKSGGNVFTCGNSSLYEIFTKIHKHFNITTSLAKVKQWDIINENQFKAVCNFECLVCFYKTSVFGDWKCHILSISHLENCNKIEDLYSYVCTTKECKVLLYGSKTSLGKHRMKNHSENFLIPPGVSILMAEVIKRFITKQKPLYYCSHCKKFEETPIIHTDTATNGVKNPIDFYCKFCRVTFFSSAEMIDYHSLSVEHMTLKCLDELCSTNKILSEPSNKKETNTLLPNAIVSNSELLNNVDNVQLFQEPVVNNDDGLQKIDDNNQSNTCKAYNEENMELPNLSKPKYIHYFKQKMEILNKLKTFKDCLLKTLSYYCEPCDFIEEDKNKFLNHNQTKHPDTDNRLPIFCLTCSMYIYGSDTKNHNLTIEHSFLLKFSQSCEHLENDLTYNSALINSNESNNISNEISPEIIKEFELNNIDGIKECQNSNFKDGKHNDTLTYKKQNETIITNSSTLDLGQIKHNNDTMITSNSVKPISSKNTILHYQPNVNEMMKININCVDISTSTDDLSNLYYSMNNLDTNKKPQEEIARAENKAYGEYVAQRLQYIDDSTVKQNIKLEIDFLFYEKIKELSQKNIK